MSVPEMEAVDLAAVIGAIDVLATAVVVGCIVVVVTAAGMLNAIGERRSLAEARSIRQGWFHLPAGKEEELLALQKALLESARERMTCLSPSRMLPEDSYGALFPWPLDVPTLWLILPMPGKGKDRPGYWADAVQIGLGGNQIFGYLGDAIYMWDGDPSSEKILRTIGIGEEEDAISDALDWLEAELRKRNLLLPVESGP